VPCSCQEHVQDRMDRTIMQRAPDRVAVCGNTVGTGITVLSDNTNIMLEY